MLQNKKYEYIEMKHYLDRKRKNSSFNLTSNINNQRIDNTAARQFRQTHNPIKNTEYITDEITDAQGLERAYADGNYYIHGNTMYIAGSHTAKDWYGDVTKIPFWGDRRKPIRYQAAGDALMQHPDVK